MEVTVEVSLAVIGEKRVTFSQAREMAAVPRIGDMYELTEAGLWCRVIAVLHTFYGEVEVLCEDMEVWGEEFVPCQGS